MTEPKKVKAKKEPLQQVQEEEAVELPPRETVSTESKLAVPTIFNDRITVFTRDQQGNIFGVVSMHRNNVLDVTYQGINHELIISLTGLAGQGATTFDPFQNFKVEGNKKVLLPSYTNLLNYKEQYYNPSIIIRDPSEMEKIWRWLQHDKNDMTWEQLMEIRAAIVARVEKAKAEAEKKKQEQEGQQQESDAGKLVDMHGQDLPKE